MVFTMTLTQHTHTKTESSEKAENITPNRNMKTLLTNISKSLSPGKKDNVGGADSVGGAS